LVGNQARPLASKVRCGTMPFVPAAGSWYENHKDFDFETNRFLDASDGIISIVTSAAAD
jgi:hypothetical protein